VSGSQKYDPNNPDRVENLSKKPLHPSREELKQSITDAAPNNSLNPSGTGLLFILQELKA
jgi:hypothetical protein